MVLDHIFLEQVGGVNSNSLCYLLNNNVPRNNNVDIIDVEPDIMQHSSYHDDDSLTNLFEAKADVFSILPIFKQLHLLKSYDIYKCQLLKFLLILS